MHEIPAREEVIELAEEQLEVAKRAVERGRVVIRTRIDTREEIAEATLRHEDLSIERVPVDRVVEVAPWVREEDGDTIAPVLEERLVITTELVLKEELRITRRTCTEVVRGPVRLRSERAEVERLEGAPTDDHTHEHERKDAVDDGADSHRPL